MSRSSLQAVLDQQARAMSKAEPALDTKIGARTEAAAERPTKFHRPSRAGRKLIAGHFDPKVAKQLKLLAVEGDTTVQALLEEALDLLFVKKGKGPISRS